MAKKSAIQKNLRRERMVAKMADKRKALKEKIMDRKGAPEERIQAVLEMAKLPRNGAKVRVKLRCGLTGRPHANYRKFKLSRIALRDLASRGLIPGMVKASW